MSIFANGYMMARVKRAAVIALGLLSLVAVRAPAESASFPASRDNTLYEDPSGSLSNGAGDYLFAGRTSVNTNFVLRRGLLAFDLSQIPPGSIVVAARLRLYMSMTIAADVTVTLHRATTAWGEGSSDAELEEGMGAPATSGDATWKHAVSPSEPWDDLGGDFVSAATAQQTVDDAGTYQWGSTSAMIADVQRWIDNPSTNRGWVVRGDELEDGTAKRFNSRENPAAGRTPRLEVDFVSADELLFHDGFESGDTSFWSASSP